jgi:hypothetical protein
MNAPNVPALTAATDFEIADPSSILLAEFCPDGDIKEVLMDPTQTEGTEDGDIPFSSTPVATARGIRLHRVWGPDREPVTEPTQAEGSPLGTRTDMEFLRGRGVVYLASARPGPVYTWQITAVCADTAEEGKRIDVATVLGTRSATGPEAARLDTVYRGWLTAQKDFDDKMNALAEFSKETSSLIESLRLLPPVPPEGGETVEG